VFECAKNVWTLVVPKSATKSQRMIIFNGRGLHTHWNLRFWHVLQREVRLQLLAPAAIISYALSPPTQRAIANRLEVWLGKFFKMMCVGNSHHIVRDIKRLRNTHTHYINTRCLTADEFSHASFSFLFISIQSSRRKKRRPGEERRKSVALSQFLLGGRKIIIIYLSLTFLF
jgi:hypothetical protein